MAGKNRAQKKKSNLNKKKVADEMVRKAKKLSLTITPTEKITNNARPIINPNPEPEEVTCPLCGKASDGGVHDECADIEAMKADLTPGPEDLIRQQEESEPAPFDPMSVVNQLLEKKKD